MSMPIRRCSSGIRALLLQALHPIALQAVVEHAGFRRDFWGRFQRTSRYIALTTYGTVPDAERTIAAVRAIHRRVKGTTADGWPYSADDPHLLMWVHVAEVDSFLGAFQAFGAETLTPAEADEYVRQAGFVAAQLGVVEPPTTVTELIAIMESYRPELSGSGPAREASSLLLVNPPFNGLTRAGYYPLPPAPSRSCRAGLVWNCSCQPCRLPSVPWSDHWAAQPCTHCAGPQRRVVRIWLSDWSTRFW